MRAKRVFFRFLLFALIGLLMEVFFGAGHKLIEGNWNLRGGTSPWMMLDYGLLGVVTPWIARPLKARGVPLPARAIAYMLGIFFIEYVSGILFHKVMGLHIWNYNHLPYNLHGQIALYFVVPWYLLGLVAETLFKRVDVCAVALAHGWRVEDLPGEEAPEF